MKTEQIGSMPRKKIVIFAEGHVAIDSLVKSLKDSFYGVSIQYASAADIKNNPTVLSQNTIAFILPGITGEECHYYDLLGTKGNSVINEYVNQGGTYMGICAGAYYACETVEYTPPWGNTKTQKPGLNFFNAIARGPVIANPPRPTKKNDYNDLSVIQVLKQNGQTTGVCYGNGPALTGATENNLTVIARYEGIERSPISIARKSIGSGQALFVGVVPEISTQHGIDILSPQNTSQRNNDIEKIVTELHPHEEGRAQLWHELTEIIKNHNHETGRCQRWEKQPCPA